MTFPHLSAGVPEKGSVITHKVGIFSCLLFVSCFFLFSVCFWTQCILQTKCRILFPEHFVFSNMILYDSLVEKTSMCHSNLLLAFVSTEREESQSPNTPHHSTPTLRLGKGDCLLFIRMLWRKARGWTRMPRELWVFFWNAFTWYLSVLWTYTTPLRQNVKDSVDNFSENVDTMATFCEIESYF